MIEKILPGTVASAEAFEDNSDDALFPQEAAIVAGASERRRREFATGRRCAHTALRRLGAVPLPISSSAGGAPRWPRGIVGSITHCPGYRAAAVAHTRDVLTLGLDAEPNGPLPAGVLHMISCAAERARLGHLTATAPGICWDRLLFSIKESLYKAWFPVTRRWLGCEESDVAVDVAAGTFHARLLVPALAVAHPSLTGMTGRWCAEAGLLLTAVVVPARRG